MTLHTRIQRSTRWLAALGLLLASMGIAVLSSAAAPANGATLKSYVCKFKTTPGQGEQLQSGQNPIWVSNSSLGANGPVKVGQLFNDQHGHSLVVVANTPKLNPEPSTDLCFAEADVSYTEPTCANQNTVDYAVTGRHVTGSYSGDLVAGGTITVTAHSTDNFVFPNGLDTMTFPAHTFDDAVDLNAPPCSQVQPTEVTPLAPTFTDPTCTVDAGYTLPTGPAGVTYDVAGDAVPGGHVTVTAVVHAPYVLAAGAQTVFEHTFAAAPGNCNPLPPTEVTPLAPQFQEPTCSSPAGYTLPDGPDGVTYDVTGDAVPGGEVTVTAVVHAPYVLAPGAQTVFAHTFAPLTDDCIQGPGTVAPPAPTFTDPTCANGNQASFVVPTAAGVEYVASGEAKPGAAIQVTATSTDPDKPLDTTAPSTWSHAFAAAEANCAKTVTTTTVTPVIPALVHAGLGDQLSDTRGQTGLALVAAGMLVLLVSGGLGLTRRRGSLG